MRFTEASGVEVVCGRLERPNDEAKSLWEVPPTPSIRGRRRRFAWNLLLPE